VSFNASITSSFLSAFYQFRNKVRIDAPLNSLPSHESGRTTQHGHTQTNLRSKPTDTETRDQTQLTTSLFLKTSLHVSAPMGHLQVLIIGLCILLRVYQLNTGRTSVCNKVFLALDFIVHVSHYMFWPCLGGHLQAVPKHKKYLRQSLYIQQIR
jgi:hypothetical protein